MDIVYIPPSDSDMLYKLELQLEKHNDIPLLLLGDFNAKHTVWDKSSKAPNEKSKILEDIMSRHSVQIQNDQNSTYMHNRGSSLIELVLTRGISNLKCQTKEFNLINTCHKSIITTSQNIRPIINNREYNSKHSNWNTWKTDLTSSLKKYLRGNVTLNSKSTMDLLISNLIKIINDTAQKSLKVMVIVKSWWNNQLTEVYKEYK